MDESKRKQNEKKFGTWIHTADDGRRYWYEVQGRHGWKARYFKEVNAEEVTVAFWQEIYNEQGKLVESITNSRTTSVIPDQGRARWRINDCSA